MLEQGAGMNDADRQTIKVHLSWLVDNTNVNALIPTFVQKQIFSESMVEKYLDSGGRDARIRASELYLDVARRGPSAFKKLIESFIETGHFDAAEKLEPNVNIAEYVARWGRPSAHDALPAEVSVNGSHSTTPTCIPQYLINQDPNIAERIRNAAAQNPHSNISLDLEPFKVQVKMATTRMDRKSSKEELIVYKMGSRPKGYFLMINNVNFVNNVKKDRKGAEVDEKHLKDLFEGLGYIVEPYRNQGSSDMKRKIKEFAAKKEHKNVDSCVVAVLSHGEAGMDSGSTDIYASDGCFVSTSWIVECFNAHNCRHLIGKPKIFIFQACRGDKADFGTGTPSRTSSDGYPNGIRSYPDILLAYSTIPGHVSIRDTEIGSWYIGAVCKVFMEHAHDTDIRDMLSMVDYSMRNLRSDEKAMQTSSFDNWGFQKFYFNPGLYDDDLEPTP